MALNILVTGDAGYIGSHTCKALAAAGYAPVVLDNLSTGHRWAVKWGPLVVADIGDREGDPQDPINPYGVSKLFVEKVLYWYEVAYRFRHMNLRYFNAAGADTDGEIGEDHDPKRISFHFVAAAQGVNPTFEIFGTDYDTADGTAVRDYDHVCDLARAHVNALDYLLAGGHSVSVNLGTGRGHSIRDVISAVEAVSGRSVPVVESPRRAGDPPTLIANPKLGQTLLRWAPVQSDLQTIVQTAWQWHQKTSAEPIRRRACVARPSQVQA
jgi:UDP-arabinose 4-epimerase